MRCHLTEAVQRILATDLDPDRLVGGKGNRTSIDQHGLRDDTDEIGFDALGLTVVDRAMAKLLQIEVAAEFAIEPRQQIQGESRGDTGGVVIGGFDHFRVFLQINANQGGAVGAHFASHLRQQGNRFGLGKIADGGTRKENQRALRWALRLRHHKGLGEIATDRQHFQCRQ